MTSSVARDGLGALRIDRNTGRRRRSGLVFFVLAALSLSFVVWAGRAGLRARTQAEAAPAVEVLPPLRSEVPTPLSAVGYVAAQRRATIASPVAGRLVSLPIEVGTHVKKGQLLAQVDDAAVRSRWAQARAEVDAAKSALAEIEVRVFEAEQERARQEALTARGVASRVVLHRAQNEVETRRARLLHQRALIRVAQSSVEVWRQEIARRRIVAPFAGVVVAKNAEAGEIVAPKVKQARFARDGILTLVDMGSLEFEIDVSETQIEHVRVGQPVTATVDAYPEDKIVARVVAVVPAADRQRATVRVRVAFENGDARVLPEMGVRVSFARSFDREPGAPF